MIMSWRRSVLIALVLFAGLAAISTSAGAGTKHPTYALGDARHCRTGYVRITAKKSEKVRVKLHGKWVTETKTVRYAACQYIAVAAIAPVTAPTTTPTTTTPTISTTTTSTSTTTSTTTTSTTTTTVPPAPVEISTQTTMAPVNPNDPPPLGLCNNGSFCYPLNENGETVFSVEISASGVRIAPGSGRLQFVFDAPVTDTSSSLPLEYDQFTLVTTAPGQTACPLSWVELDGDAPSYFEADPTSAATDGVPACTFLNVYLYEEPRGSDFLCTNPTGAFGSIAAVKDCPNFPTTGLEGAEFVGAALSWRVTAEYTGEGNYAPSRSAQVSFTVGASPTS